MREGDISVHHVEMRHPVDRFVSYYLERSDRHFERDLAGNLSLEEWTVPMWRKYLDMVARDKMYYSGEETGTFCNRENILCLDRLRTRDSAHPLLKRVRPSAAKERVYFRYLAGPQDRLAWILDPEQGDPRLAIWRMRRCVVGLQTEAFDEYREVLGWYFPWIHEVRKPQAADSGSQNKSSAKRQPRAAQVRQRLPRFAYDMIAEFNWRDMRIYRAAKRQFRKQLRRVRHATGRDESGQRQTRWPPVDFATADEVQSAVSRELQHLPTYQVHEGLNRYMQGF